MSVRNGCPPPRSIPYLEPTALRYMAAPSGNAYAAISGARASAIISLSDYPEAPNCAPSRRRIRGYGPTHTRRWTVMSRSSIFNRKTCEHEASSSTWRTVRGLRAVRYRNYSRGLFAPSAGSNVAECRRACRTLMIYSPELYCALPKTAERLCHQVMIMPTSGALVRSL